MNRPVLSLIGCLVLVLFASALAPAQETPEQDSPVLGDRLAVTGNASQYWVARTTTVGKNRVSSISKRLDPVTGTWAEVARFQSDLTSIAPVGARLAVLLPSGEWRLLDDAPGPLGRRLPEGYRALRFAGDDDALLAVASGSTPSTQSTTHPATRPLAAAVLRFAGNDWTVVADLPYGMVPDEADVIRAAGTLYAAGRRGASIDVWAYRGEAWEKVWSISGLTVKRFELLTGEAMPMLATMTLNGSWAVHPVGAETPIREPSEPYLPSDVAVVGPTLRIAYVEEEQVKQLAYNDYGAGDAFPVTTIAQIAQPPQAMQTWVQIGGLVLLTITMLLTFRQRPAMPGEALANAPVRVAPLGRRFAAGFIDAVPMLAGMIYSVGMLQQNHFTGVSAANAPSLIGMSIYILHVGISELIWNRSLGKMLFGLRVVNYDNSRVAPERIILRNILRLVDMLFFAPLLLILLTPMRQRVGDLAAKTIVVYEIDPEEETEDLD